MQVDKIVRQRIFASMYWKKWCYAINAAVICERAADLREVGGIYTTSQRPTPFLCLVYKLGLIAPEREIIEEMLNQKHFKYLSAVAAVYVRMVYSSRDVYELLEPLLADYRKLRCRDRSGDVYLWHMDEMIDALLTQERVFDLALPRLLSRAQLEDRGLPPREPLVNLD